MLDNYLQACYIHAMNYPPLNRVEQAVRFAQLHQNESAFLRSVIRQYEVLGRISTRQVDAIIRIKESRVTPSL